MGEEEDKDEDKRREEFIRKTKVNPLEGFLLILGLGWAIYEIVTRI